MSATLLRQPLLDKNSPLNQWFNEHPLVTGLIIFAIGAILVVIGLRDMRRGSSVDKYGTEHSGGMGRFMAIVRLVGGALAVGFGLYKIVTAFLGD